MSNALLERLRSEVGIAMGSWYAPVETTDPETNVTRTTRLVVGWTTDAAKAEAAREAGAFVQPYTSRDPACSGWEIAVHEVVSDGRSS